MPRKCCVPGCSGYTRPVHIFPLDTRICDIWIERIKSPQFIGRTHEQIRTLKVCGSHFSDVCLFGQGKLLRYSLPTLSIPGFEGDSRENSFAPPEKDDKVETPTKIRADKPSHSWCEEITDFSPRRPLSSEDTPRTYSRPRKDLLFLSSEGQEQPCSSSSVVELRPVITKSSVPDMETKGGNFDEQQLASVNDSSSH